MTQFTPTLPPLHHVTPLSNSISNNNNIQVPRTTNSWPKFQQSKALVGFGDANCMEQLLIHCADAMEANDVTLAQQILWVLNNIAPPDGDSNQRLAATFLSALTSRAAKSGSSKMLAAVTSARNTGLAIQTHRFSIIELANFVDVTPWHRFGFTAANLAILEATEGFSTIHIVDLSSTHCMQIPTLIDAIASRHDVPPLIKLTVVGASRNIPPIIDLSYDELGSKLVNFAKSKNVVMDFRVISSTHADGFAALIQYLGVHRLVTEALVINCHMMLHCIPDETLSATSTSSLRSLFLKALRSLNPTLVVLVEEDADLTPMDLVCRLRAAFNYMWIPYDTMDTFLQRGSEQRQWYEADMCWKIENVMAHEGVERVERLESKSRWEQRMRDAEFQGISFSDDAVSEVKAMLDEHAAAWGLKKEEQHLLLTWKGHNVVFASAWFLA
ncbi:scarecrow-like protein 32 [Prosopis cineraria]|uniref:scarecrow-like protein 32 n=1 Tax=Prosopis cineraria TaxID=364024 RepID=UPI00240FB493|nr:scarecrow-like protein 32 [Prosopis cineraria]